MKEISLLTPTLLGEYTYMFFRPRSFSSRRVETSNNKVMYACMHPQLKPSTRYTAHARLSACSRGYLHRDTVTVTEKSQYRHTQTRDLVFWVGAAHEKFFQAFRFSRG